MLSTETRNDDLFTFVIHTRELQSGLPRAIRLIANRPFEAANAFETSSYDEYLLGLPRCLEEPS